MADVLAPELEYGLKPYRPELWGCLLFSLSQRQQCTQHVNTSSKASVEHSQSTGVGVIQQCGDWQHIFQLIERPAMGAIAWTELSLKEAAAFVLHCLLAGATVKKKRGAAESSMRRGVTSCDVCVCVTAGNPHTHANLHSFSIKAIDVHNASTFLNIIIYI